MESSSPAQNRRSRRSSVLLTATLKAGAGSLAVKLRNLSAEGALVEADDLPVEGTPVLFERSELCVRGRIVWVNGKHAGIAFEHALPPEQVLRHVPSPRPRVRPEFRRPGLACRELSADERRLVESWIWAPTVERVGD